MPFFFLENQHLIRTMRGIIMKILVIHGSMRKGNTYSLTKEIVDRLSAKGDDTLWEIRDKF